jgi:tetraacyldisaccharide 4'-kinase
MKAPAFWNAPPGLLARLLSPLGWLYGRITAARMARAGARLDVPVICIGNFTAGGAGKTPTALWIVAWALRQGLRPVVLSRGYGGKLSGPLVVDPARHGAGDCGDEPLLLARTAPVVIGADRLAGTRLAATLGDVIVMDDGMQNPAVAKDAVIAVADGGAGLGNGFCLPAGPLRAPLARQLPHVSAMLVIGEGAAGETVADSARRAGKPVIRGMLAPDPGTIARLAGRPLLAFAGIGRPEKFFETLRRAGLDVRTTRSFADHHAFTLAEARVLAADAATAGLTLVTTEKDAVRWPASAGPLETLPVSLAMQPDDEAALQALLSARIRRAI